jgi:hypothetical protein
MTPTPVETSIEQHPSVTGAPLPTRRTLRRRRNVPLQFIRFVTFNVRMALLAMRGHR